MSANMAARFGIAIVGAGPAGLSAAAQAAHYDRASDRQRPSYILLEASGDCAQTVQNYQVGKHVMDEPRYLGLRSAMPFGASSRESVLEDWTAAVQQQGINVRYNAEVVSIEGSQGNFALALRDGSSVAADHVVLAIGTQGNPRQLGVEGDQASDFVRYTLDDPGKFNDEVIVVVGAGDSAVENAVALGKSNTVHIVNRRGEFSRCKDGNLAAVLAAINDPNNAFYCSYASTVARLELPREADSQGAVVLDTPSGARRIECHRVFARLGSIPPRDFLESCGIAVGGQAPMATPVLDRRYQSSVPGLFVIGALGGYALIKQALNQGYEVVDFIHGKDTKPADYPLLKERFSGLPYALDAEDVLDLYQDRIPMFRRMNPLAFRELMIESKVILSPPADEYRNEATLSRTRDTTLVRDGDTLYRHGEYTTGFYTVVEGEVTIKLERDGLEQQIGAGQFFGEMSLISGRPREGDAVVGRNSILIETPRRIMVKLMNSNEDVRAGIDHVFVLRALQKAFRPNMDVPALAEVAAEIETCRFDAGDVLFEEGTFGDCLHLIRSGTVALSRQGRETVVAQHHSGELVGQMALMGIPDRRETAVAAVRTETLRIGRSQFLALVRGRPEHVERLQTDLSTALRASNAMESRPDAARVFGFLMEQGLGEATDAMLIDETLCVGCDNCERACAETHDGVSRLNREAGASFASVHVPITCRHCELPHCMKDCPPDAIRRSADGDVYIDDSCIGCGNCETNCPYDAIKMTYRAPSKPGLLSWVLFGRGPGPGESPGFEPTQEARDAGRKAVKCDACASQPGGPACVRACPTGAAVRLAPTQFLAGILGG